MSLVRRRTIQSNPKSRHGHPYPSIISYQYQSRHEALASIEIAEKMEMEIQSEKLRNTKYPAHIISEQAESRDGFGYGLIYQSKNTSQLHAFLTPTLSLSLSLDMEDAQRTLQKSIETMMDSIHKLKLAPIAKAMYSNMSKCYDQGLNDRQSQECVQSHARYMEAIQSMMQNEMSQMQNRLQRGQQR